VQHQGVLPSFDQLGRWAAETETFVRDLVSTVFGVDLRDASAASAVADTKLRELLHRADEQLEAGDAHGAFESASEALDEARRNWRARRLGAAAEFPFSGIAKYHEFREIHSAISGVVEQLEIATFTSDMAEWLWLRHERGRDGPPHTIEDARRALVFVITWVLRFESHAARFPAPRWDEWRASQVAPRTGLQGAGPRILHAELDESVRPHPEMAYWQFQIADLPTADDEFMTAVSVASSEGRDSPERVTMSLGLRGELRVAAPRDLPADKMVAAVRHGLNRAAQIVADRNARNRELAEEAEARAQPYREAFGEAAGRGAPFGAVHVSLSDDRHASPAPSRVSVELTSADLGTDYWNALSEAMRELELEEECQGFTVLDSLVFPLSCAAPRAVVWALRGIEIARTKLARQEVERSAERDWREATLEAVRRLLAEDSKAD
jgi:hypothetical protein